MIPYDPDWEYGYDEIDIQFTRGHHYRKKRRKEPEPVIALYTKTVLVEEADAVLGDRCRAIVVE
jgi:hypothetical protein